MPHRSSYLKNIYFIGLLALWLLSPAATADIRQLLMPTAPNLDTTSYFLMDFDSGYIIVDTNSDKRVGPASITKIMTAYVAFNELINGNLALEDKVTISKKAWRTGGSRMFIEVGKQVSMENLLRGMIIQSGNDASIAIAEHIAGDEATFAELMNQHAQRLGMENTHFVNSTGLPHAEHHATARDLAMLTRALIKEFPQFYKWHSIKEFTFNNIKQYNRNKLLWKNDSVDGVKTGHTEEAGFCLVASAYRDGMRLIAVVMGATSENARTSDSQTLLNYGFRFFETHKLYKAQDTLADTKVWKGETDNLKLGLDQDLYVTIPRNHYKDLSATMEIDKQIQAPVKQGSSLGIVNITLNEDTIVTRPLIALENIKKGGTLKRVYDEILLLLE